jgi:hypothetical protein
MEVKWSEEWADRPIFRDIEGKSATPRVSETKVLQYEKQRHGFVRLGRSVGFEKNVEFYDLRRASGKKITGMRFPIPVER